MREKIIAVINALGLGDKMTNKKLTADDWAQIAESFKETHGTDLNEAMAASERADQMQETIDMAMGLIEQSGSTEGTEGYDLASAISGLTSKMDQLESQNADLLRQIAKMGQDRDGSGVNTVVGVLGEINAFSRIHTPTHAFGLEHEYFARSLRWNELTVNRQTLIQGYSQSEEEQLRRHFMSFSQNFRSRYNELVSTDAIHDLIAGTPDYSGIEDDLGNQYLIRRTDALIVYMHSLPSCTHLFPVRYGVQDKEVIVGAMPTGSYSHAWQTGRVFGGGIKFAPEFAKVDDAMFKFNFGDLKTLERAYIGYLNKEGSSPYKWSFVEWLMATAMLKLHNEREQRRIMGIRIDPIEGEAGHHNHAANGVISQIDFWEEEYKILPFEDLGMYTPATFVDLIEILAEYLNQLLPSLDGIQIMVNQKHIPWYKQGFRKKYSADGDFNGTSKNITDYSIKELVGVPNMGNSQKIIVCAPGLIELLEMAPGEMANMKYETNIEELIVWSIWKEGVGAEKVGVKFKEKQTEIDSEKQLIFTTNPLVELEADQTNPDASKYHIFKTKDNSGATVINDIAKARDGQWYKIICGGTTNASRVNKNGKFDQITENWIPNAIGDYIIVAYDKSKDKFYEARRKVTP